MGGLGRTEDDRRPRRSSPVSSSPAIPAGDWGMCPTLRFWGPGRYSAGITHGRPGGRVRPLDTVGRSPTGAAERDARLPSRKESIVRLRIAFVGFRHAHVHGLYNLARTHAGLEVVAACEEDAETRARLGDSGIAVTHDRYSAMLDEAPCDIVARRLFRPPRRAGHPGARTGKHVLCDKPLCVHLDELNRIETLAARRTAAWAAC